MGILERLLAPFSKREDPVVRSIYDKIVTQARHPAFYVNQRVDDTVSGRFDMIVLHAFLIFFRLKREDETARAFGQEIFDTFIEDMDRSLREMGVGYQAVPKRMKKMGEAFYGRIDAYDKALTAQDRGLMIEAISRNILTEHEEANFIATCLCDYVFANLDVLETLSINELKAGNIRFADPSPYMDLSGFS